MSTKKIYFVRHGQTDFNKNSIVQGASIDAPLNKTGFLQAKALFQYYKQLAFDKVYTSALVRTKETVQQFLDLGISHTSLTALNEISFGIYDGTKHTTAENGVLNQIVKKWNQGETHLKTEEGESPEDLALKQQDFIELVKKDPSERVLVCMHGRAMRILLCQLMGESLAEMDKYKHHNTCVYVVSYENGVFQLEETNSLAHLEAYETEEQLIF
ncbi:MAG: histidine phosphatase family protein [Cyclobacteriaceae bacterium]